MPYSNKFLCIETVDFTRALRLTLTSITLLLTLIHLLILDILHITLNSNLTNPVVHRRE
jgi:hypothetical protein